ncbi:MAG TPA: hypothetical protein DHR80_08990 [Thalassospira lucentensis]|uniref:Uncharacterized protein n=1 Tax=Thalassospira lucentensis TaxID=168935 RepID=A0A3D5N7C5_9PROT|nr:hypothetical protein [Thalassospira lucentensis]
MARGSLAGVMEQRSAPKAKNQPRRGTVCITLATIYAIRHRTGEDFYHSAQGANSSKEKRAIPTRLTLLHRVI